MSDPSYSDSDGTSYMEMVYFVNDSDFGIPERFPCGSQIIIQISTEAELIPKKYFVCKDFKATVGDNESRMRSLGGLGYRVDGIDKASQKNDGEIAHLGYQIDEIDKASKKNADEIAQLKAIIEKR
ncbi:hypothetical protein Bca52824_017486 [Brassica carinata]|uniref:Uncharacterized protein n=1 Tax=Brassica carinata TaxID=52824 RepID=A0A8X8AVF5_BRACI|nr:hypothetical protein Bca52824_017486 [Brassica carinata]